MRKSESTAPCMHAGKPLVQCMVMLMGLLCSSNAQLDWTVDGQAFNVLYLGLNGNNGHVAPGDGGNANGYVPSTMAIWGQLETAPYDLRTSGNLSITENSDAGTMVDQFTASDNNDNNLLHASCSAQ